MLASFHSDKSGNSSFQKEGKQNLVDAEVKFTLILPLTVLPNKVFT